MGNNAEIIRLNDPGRQLILLKDVIIKPIQFGSNL